MLFPEHNQYILTSGYLNAPFWNSILSYIHLDFSCTSFNVLRVLLKHYLLKEAFLDFLSKLVATILVYLLVLFYFSSKNLGIWYYIMHAFVNSTISSKRIELLEDRDLGLFVDNFTLVSRTLCALYRIEEKACSQ